MVNEWRQHIVLQMVKQLCEVPTKDWLGDQLQSSENWGTVLLIRSSLINGLNMLTFLKILESKSASSEVFSNNWEGRLFKIVGSGIWEEEGTAGWESSGLGLKKLVILALGLARAANRCSWPTMCFFQFLSLLVPITMFWLQMLHQCPCWESVITGAC